MGEICYHFDNQTQNRLRITFRYRRGTDSPGSDRPHGVIFLGALGEPDDIAKRHQIWPETCSPDTVELAKTWFERCTQEHSTCNERRGNTNHYPTRLLDLGPPSVDINVRLVETNDVVKGEPYIALSHCWGGDVPTMLKRSTIQKFKSGINVEELPTSFKHAIYTTRQISVRYLWIDSLCIIQDSDQDWEQEAGKMRDVYTRAILTIAATGAENSSQGFTFKRDPILIQPLTVDIALNPAVGIDLNPTNFIPLNPWYNGIHILFDADSWVKNVILAPLSQRAWAVQERLLSPSVLHFGRDQIAWECQEMQACEIFPEGVPWVLGSNADLECKTLLASKRRSSLARWERIVETYSPCQLTREGDICIALAGVAEEFQVQTDDIYVAGLWASSLITQLCWATQKFKNEDRNQIPSRPAKYRAPSWSWMSVKSSVQFYEPEKESTLFEILDYNIQNTSESKFGSIQRGYLVGHGFLKPARWSNLWMKLVVDGESVENGHFWGHSIPQVIMDLEDNEPSDVFCLPLIQDTLPRFVGKGVYIGLIVAPIYAKVEVYKRIGCFQFHKHFGDHCFLHHHFSDGKVASLPKRTITIV